MHAYKNTHADGTYNLFTLHDMYRKQGCSYSTVCAQYSVHDHLRMLVVTFAAFGRAQHLCRIIIFKIIIEGSRIWCNPQIEFPEMSKNQVKIY